MINAVKNEETKVPDSDQDGGVALEFSRANLGPFARLLPFKELVTKHSALVGMGTGELPVEHYRKVLLNFFPIVESFPKFMAANLAKTRYDRPGHEEAKLWLINNIRVEKNHSRWYMDWAEGFGISKEEMLKHRPSPEANALLQHLWSVSNRQSLTCAFASTNVGVEWATGEWACAAKDGMQLYVDRGQARNDSRKARIWLDVHADYDDMHPYEAMTLAYRCAESESDLLDGLAAAERTLEHYSMALQSSLKPTIH